MTPGSDGAARAAEGASAPVVVTGAAGFVGRALCAHFAAAGRPHRAIVRDLPPGVARVATRIALGDLATAPAARLAAALEGAAVVVHLAGRAHALVEPAAEAEYHAANVTATERLAAAAVAAGVRRFVLASTVKVYGEATLPGRPWRAGDPPDPARCLRAQQARGRACAGRSLRRRRDDARSSCGSRWSTVRASARISWRCSRPSPGARRCRCARSPIAATCATSATSCTPSPR